MEKGWPFDGGFKVVKQKKLTMYQYGCHAPCMIYTPFCGNRHVKSFRPRYISETQNKESFFVHIKPFHPRVLESQITCILYSNPFKLDSLGFCLFICTYTSKQDCHSLIGPFLKELLVITLFYLEYLNNFLCTNLHRRIIRYLT